MSYKEKAIPLIERLNSYEHNLKLTDGYKTKVPLSFNLSSDTDEDYFYAEVENLNEYIEITNYIKSQVNLQQFSFSTKEFKDSDKYLTIGI